MKTELIRIGNSRGIRIPKPIIEQCQFGDTVDLRMEDDRLIISGDRPARHGWDEAFRAAGTSAKDPLLLAPLTRNKFDREEWEW